jgi:hypothetical protein
MSLTIAKRATSLGLGQPPGAPALAACQARLTRNAHREKRKETSMKSACTWFHLVLAAAALGCGGGPPPSTEGLHQACTPGSACASGQLCLEYTGFAGQPLSTCEIPCDYAADCPAPLSCSSISDGPRQTICN